MKRIFVIASALLWAQTAFAAAPGVAISPGEIFQGDPVLITATGGTLSKTTFDGKNYPVFMYAGKSESLIGIELGKKPGTYQIKAVFKGGKMATTTIIVAERPKPVAPTQVSIPDALGGNTSSSQKALVASISKETAALRKAFTGKISYWTKNFMAPLAAMAVTNPYGYGVDTGANVLAHKGVDLKAATGTKVFAMNRGVVRLTRTYKAYGKTVLIDHGLGLQTMYLHLSKINVREGSTVARGQVIGLSGATGYADGPHLHLSVRINGVSIDPVKFMNLF